MDIAAVFMYFLRLPSTHDTDSVKPARFFFWIAEAILGKLR